jgi:hypothetical protein
MLSVSSSARSAENARKCIEAVNEWYSQASTNDAVRALAREVRAWLSTNRYSTDKRGDEVSKPWWPQLPFSNDDDRIDVRRSLLRGKIFGHGQRRLLNRMTSNDLLGDGAYELIDGAANQYNAMAVHDELVGYVLSEDPKKTISLKDVRDRYGYSEKYKPTRLRDPLVVPMATFGLWKVKVDNENRFAISLGLVGEIFFREVFSPVRKEFEPRIKGEE